MNNKSRFVAILLTILFVILSKYLITAVISLQKALSLLNHEDSILYTISSKGFLIAESLSIFILMMIVVAILYEMYRSKKANKSYKNSSAYKANNRLLKGATVLSLFIVLICGRCFTIVTTDKIYYSSLSTLFFTKSYDYSEVKEINIESSKKRKSGYILEYNISFANHTVNLMNSLDEDKDIQINKVHKNIIEKSKDVMSKQNLTYKTEKILNKVSILTDLD